MSLVSLSELIARRTQNANSSEVRFHITEDWLQGRTTFGGLIAALGVQTMHDVAVSTWDGAVPLRSIQTSFIGPVSLGAVDVQVQVLREGKNVRQVQAHVRQDGQLAAVLLGVFGAGRPTSVPAFDPSAPALGVTPEDARVLPFAPGQAPSFTQHLEARWAAGPLPGTAELSHHNAIYVRLKGEPPSAPLHPEVHVVMLADMPPSPVLSLFPQRVPASSVSWELQLRPFTAPTTDDPWWRVDTDVLAAGEGYVNQVSRLWTPNGELAALGYQVVAVFG